MGDAPVTEIGIIADGSRCPQDFIVLSKASDGSDGDLWPDRVLAWNKITRYICYSRRSHDQSGVPNEIVNDIVFINDRDEIPSGYISCDITLDTKEKAIQKKILCFRKSVPGSNDRTGVTDIIIVNRKKRPPSGYTLVGDANNLLVCMKVRSVTGVMASSTGVLYTAPQNVSMVGRPAPPPPPPVYAPPLVKRTESKITNPLSGVPFQIHKNYAEDGQVNADAFMDIKFKSPVQIDNEFSYNFENERAVLSQG